MENTFRKSLAYRGVVVDVSIRDTAGQDELTIFPPRLMLGVHGYLLVYSVCNRYSFQTVEYINDKLLTNMMGSTDNIPRVLVANMNDLEEYRPVPF